MIVKIIVYGMVLLVVSVLALYLWSWRQQKQVDEAITDFRGGIPFDLDRDECD